MFSSVTRFCSLQLKQALKKCKRQLVCRSWLAKELCGRENRRPVSSSCWNDKWQLALPGEHVSDTEQVHDRSQSDPVGSSGSVS